MNQSDEREREIRELRERLSRLSEASLRVNESLDFDAVLQGVLDSARSLTGARYGVMTLLDDSGDLQDHLSSGMSAEEAGLMWEVPEGMALFEYLGGITEPLRIPDLQGHVRSLGFPGFRLPLPVGPAMSFLAMPVLHREERLGNIFVGEKDAEPEFSADDEETLVMFASQAALVIANARRYRDERRARSDLETLIDTSPVGVVVFDARTGVPVSFNREAIRLADMLREPEQSPEALLGIITVRRADGREVSLKEFSMAGLLRAGETVRAEEIVMRVPDGRSVSALVNGTPILSQDGEVESFMVTLQDMTSVEELERLRAEFLAIVSQELRVPLSTIKGSAATALGALSSMERVEMEQFFRIIDSQADRMHYLIGGLLDVARIETGTLSVSPEPTDLSSMVEEARRVFLSAGGVNALEIDLPPDLPWVMADRGRIVQVIGSLLSNGSRHSPEGASIRVSAEREGVHVALSVSDEGRGVSVENLPRLFGKFSRIDGGERGGGIAGSGLSLAICKGIVEGHGGRIRAESDGPGLGARFTFILPAVEAEVVAASVEPAPLSHPASSEQARILAVDKDPQTLRLVRDALSEAGYSPIVTSLPEEAPHLMARKPHLVLLDMALPGSDGIRLMNDIRETSDAPIIFLAAPGEEEMTARALDSGAADYLVKPFSPTELVARIRAALRRSAATEWAGRSGSYSLGDLSIDYGQRRVRLAGHPVQLTATEYDLLYLLATSDGRVLSRDLLLGRIWGTERSEQHWLLRNVVKRLRRKLNDDAQNPTYIFTEPRVGYRMPATEESPAPNDAYD